VFVRAKQATVLFEGKPVDAENARHVIHWSPDCARRALAYQPGGADQRVALLPDGVDECPDTSRIRSDHSVVKREALQDESWRVARGKENGKAVGGKLREIRLPRLARVDAPGTQLRGDALPIDVEEGDIAARQSRTSQHFIDQHLREGAERYAHALARQ